MSSDEALCEMLGLPSFPTNQEDDDDTLEEDDDEDDVAIKKVRSFSDLLQLDDLYIQSRMEASGCPLLYQSESVCVLPQELSVPADVMRRLADEIIWGSNMNTNSSVTGDVVGHHGIESCPTATTTRGGGHIDRSYETIQMYKHGHVIQRPTLTRLEDFVSHHPGWGKLCYNYLPRCIAAILGGMTSMVLFKEKLNLKPSGGAGYAPHLDGPSLRVAFANATSNRMAQTQQHQQQQHEQDDDNRDDGAASTTADAAASAADGGGGPRTFVTVMIAIDDMNVQNGCLKFAKGIWSESNACPVVPPQVDGNPDASGRAGAIPIDVAENLLFEDLVCKGGTIAIFNAWIPHRSGINMSPFPRRAVFLTYNLADEGDYHAMYYQRMRSLRRGWKEKTPWLELQKAQQGDPKNPVDDEAQQWLATIPKI